MLNQSTKKTDLAVCFFLVSQRGGDIKNKQTGQKTPYNWILQHPWVVQPPIANDCLKLSIAVQTETKLVPKFSLQVLVRELDNKMVSPP